MKGKSFDEAVQMAKNSYFKTADSVLENRGLKDASADTFRQLIGLQTKKKKPVAKKAAS